MLTAEQNDLYTRVGPGTPCGDLMRRYWHPLSTVSKMKTITRSRSACWARTWCSIRIGRAHTGWSRRSAHTDAWG